MRFTGRAASACWNSSLYVQRQLGHSSIRITVDVYGRWLPTGNRDAVDRLAGVNEFVQRAASGSKTVANAARKSRKPYGLKKISTKIVEQDILRLHSQAVQHLHARLEHERRTTEVVLDVLGCGMILQIVVINDLVDEPRVPCPVVLG